MRLNRGTIALIAVALVVIIGVIVIQNQQANAPGTPTPTPGAVSVPVAEGITIENISSMTLRDNLAGRVSTFTRDAGGAISISGTNTFDRAVDQIAAQTAITNALALRGEGQFAAADLAAFGLVNPAYTLTMTTLTGEQITLHIGGQNPSGTRYYGILTRESGLSTPEAAASVALTAEATIESPPDATAEATTDATDVVIAPTSEFITVVPQPTPTPYITLSAPQNVVLLPRDAINVLVGYITIPPFVPAPTQPPPPTSTPNPFSEVDQTATAQREIDDFIATMAAITEEPSFDLVPDTTREATAEAEATPETAIEATAESTPDTTAEATAAAP